MEYPVTVAVMALAEKMIAVRDLKESYYSGKAYSHPALGEHIQGGNSVPLQQAIVEQKEQDAQLKGAERYLSIFSKVMSTFDQETVTILSSYYKTKQIRNTAKDLILHRKVVSKKLSCAESRFVEAFKGLDLSRFAMTVKKPTEKAAAEDKADE